MSEDNATHLPKWALERMALLEQRVAQLRDELSANNAGPSSARERTPVEQLHVGDVVQAVDHGPRGVVVSVDQGWTVACYETGKMFYRHAVDRLYVVTEVGGRV